MRIDWWTLALQAINLLVLVWLLGRFLLKPLAGIVAQRQSDARRLLDEAAATRAAADAELARISREREAIVAGKAAVLAEAESEAVERRKALLDAAHSEADHIREEAKGEAVQIVAGAEREIGGRAGVLAIDICARVLARAPGLAGPEAWLPGLIEALAALPEASRLRIAAGPVKLTFAHLPDSAGVDACRRALEKAIGAPLNLAVAEDTGLLAGIELSASETVVRNHLRADFDRIAATLAADD